jgi:excisionase family DNA binding protein
LGERLDREIARAREELKTGARQGHAADEMEGLTVPKTRKKAAPQPVTPPSVVTNGPGGEVFTLAEAAAYLRLSQAHLIDLLHSQGLPGRFIGTEWRFLKSAIQQWLSSGSPSLQARKEAQLALAGKYKDDADLMRICEEAYRQRGRPLTESE